MLEQKDLQAIADLIDSRVGRTEEVLIGKIDALEEKITEVETSLVNELVRTEDKLIRRIEKLEHELEELNQYYRINKLESDNTGLILQILEGYNKRLQILEKKIA